MAEGGGGGSAFPVTLFDGEKEKNIGNVKIKATMDYKQFELILSQKIGISPNLILIYLADRNKGSKFPLTGKVDFSLICGQKDCGFVVVLKRSRKSKNRSRAKFINADYYLRNDVVLVRSKDQTVPFYDQVQDDFSSKETGRRSIKYCEECANAEANRMAASFHPCVNDPVVTRFVTPVGPINGPKSLLTGRFVC